MRLTENCDMDKENILCMMKISCCLDANVSYWRHFLHTRNQRGGL